MNYEQINTYILVAETGSFSKAAEQLFVSDVAVLKQIRSLEKEFSSSFFKRGKTGCILTEEGVIFLRKAKEFVKLYSELETLLRESRNNRDVIKLGYDSDLGSRYLLPLLRSFSQLSTTSLELVKCKYSEFFDKISDGIIDTAFVAEPNKHCPKKLVFHETIRTDYYALYRKDNKYFDKNEIALKDLEGIDVYFSPIRYSDSYDYFLKNISRKQLKPIGINDFINTTAEGVYITTGLTEKVDDEFNLIRISDLNSSWGLLVREDTDSELNKLLEVAKKLF